VESIPRIDSTDLLDELLEVARKDVLDIGCGDGWLARRLAASGARVVGVDPQSEVLKRARLIDTQPGVSYVQAGAQELPLPDASFDAAIFFNSLHHVPIGAIDAALAEAARVLRPRGLLYVQEPLPAGELFELVSAIEDETEARERSLSALDRAATAGPLVQVTRREAINTVRIADFDAFRNRLTGVDPSRAAAIDAHVETLRARYESFGRSCDAGRQFDQPVRVYLFERRALRPATTLSTSALDRV
jgi:SAM-dependent methyltransferase